MCYSRVHQDNVEKDNFPVACTSPVIVIRMAWVTDDRSHCSDVSHQSNRKSSNSEPMPLLARIWHRIWFDCSVKKTHQSSTLLYVAQEISWWGVNSRAEQYCHGRLTRYVKLPVANAPGMPGTFSPPPHVRHACAVLHVVIAYPLWRGKCSRHFRHMHNRNFTYLVRRGPWCHFDTVLQWNL